MEVAADSFTNPLSAHLSAIVKDRQARKAHTLNVSVSAL